MIGVEGGASCVAEEAPQLDDGRVFGMEPTGEVSAEDTLE